MLVWGICLPLSQACWHWIAVAEQGYSLRLAALTHVTTVFTLGQLR